MTLLPAGRCSWQFLPGLLSLRLLRTPWGLLAGANYFSQSQRASDAGRSREPTDMGTLKMVLERPDSDFRTRVLVYQVGNDCPA